MGFKFPNEMPIYVGANLRIRLMYAKIEKGKLRFALVKIQLF
jgi:hypothetical protein